MAQSKTSVYRSLVSKPTLPQPQRTQNNQIFGRSLPITVLFFTACTMLFIKAILPLRSLWFYDSLTAQLGSWTLFPTRLLFPHLQIILGQTRTHMAISLSAGWKETGLFFAAFTLLFLLYLLAVYILPTRISHRYILLSTILLGLLFVFCPIVTSQDLFSYIAYTRMEMIYHLDPLTTVPAQISHDPVYPNIFWVNQPSIYGPVWTLLTCVLQWISLLVFGTKQILPMVLFLRVLDLTLHLASVQLVWSIIGQLQHLNGRYTEQMQTKRIRATLAFAWNPLLHNGQRLLPLHLGTPGRCCPSLISLSSDILSWLMAMVIALCCPRHRSFNQRRTKKESLLATEVAYHACNNTSSLIVPA